MAELTHLSGWSISADEFPSHGTDAAQLRFALGYAILAPSSHNSQPWLFTIDDDCVDVLADRVRALPVVDPFDRELTISCGAAVETLVVALKGMGRTSTVSLLPDPVHPEVLAQVKLTGSVPPTSSEEVSLLSISRRCSNRGPFTVDGVLPHVVERLVELAAGYGVMMHVASPHQRSELAMVISESDRHQMADHRFRRELAAWTHANRSDHDDGLRGYSLGTADLTSAITPLVLRTFDVGRGQAAKDHELAIGSPLLVVFTTPSDTATDWLNVGRALARVFIEISSFELAASFLNQPIEVDEHRGLVAKTLRTGQVPQLVMRVGAPTETFPHTPRRDVNDVLVVSAHWEDFAT